MKYFSKSAAVLTLALLAAVPARGADVIINEVMYHPSSENVLEEYIELFNKGANTVDLHGWRLSKGVDFTFTNVVMAPGSYLVVAADLPTFQAKYPGVAALGNWTGVLKNGGEEIELENAAGQAEDSVPYANEGNWGTRRRSLSLAGWRGWEWFADHDGLGTSLELINPDLPNQYGQNWASSIPLNGTPGVINSVRAANIAPLLLDTQHSPAIPRSTDLVTITTRVRDESSNGLAVALFYRNHSTIAPPSFSSTNMVDDGLHGDGLPGDGVYGVILPSNGDGTVIEFYVQGVDALSNIRTWPAPASVALDQAGPPTQTANAIYQVDESVYAGNQPIYRLIMTESERSQYNSMNRGSDAQMNTTLVSVDPINTEVRYNCGLRFRGNSSRGRTPPPNRLNIPSDRLWYGVSEANLNTQYTYLQLAGSQLAQKSGAVSANGRAVQVRINGVNPASSGTPQFGSYVHLEPLNAEWAAAHFPDDGNGNIYRASTGNHNADLSYGTTSTYFLNRGYTKASNSSENDWSDLIHLTDVLNNTPNNAYATAVREVVNVELWMRYFAIMSMLTSLETSLATGRGDDYSTYRGIIDPRFLVIPYDLDTVLGDGDTAPQPTAPLFRMMNGVVPVLNRFMSEPEFTPIYYRELLRMLDTTFSPAQLDPMLERLLGDFVPQTDIDRLKAYQVQRNNYVRSQIPLALTATNTLTKVNGYPRTTTPTASLNGRANVLETRSVRANGAPANWVATQGTWTISGVALRPGINRVVVQAFDVNGIELEQATVDIWYDDGSVVSVSGTIDFDTTWTAANGPYSVTGNLGVSPGATLTIEPGTTVYFAAGAGMNVAGTLIAEGTETQRIRFTRIPSLSGSWTGLVIDETPGESRISYADFEFADSGPANIAVSSATLFLDHVTWSNTSRGILTLSSASLSVRDSRFPTLAGATHIQGNFIPPGGFVIIERNTFGGTSLLNDIINFRGAQRPGRVLQVLDNIFTSASDDVLDLDGSDAHIEGNLFMRVHKNNSTPGDSSSAIAFGRFGGYAPHIVAVRNLFFDVDHVALVKDGGYLTFVNNTAVGVNIAAINFSEPELATLPGFGANLDGNIFFNPPGYSGTNFQNRLPANGTVELNLARNVFAANDGVSHGINANLVTDPRLENTQTNTITVASIRRDFALRSGSPAIGTGPNGLDRGALVPAGASISGEPFSPTSLVDATLIVGGPGIANYVYRVNGGAYSSERPVSTPIVLSGLANGSYTVEVLGRNSAGVQQSFESPTVSRTWSVNTTLERLVINEVLARNVSTLSVSGQSPDLIELQNTGGTTIDLAGMGFTDDPLDPYKFSFADNTIMEPGEYRVFYAESGSDAALYFGFALSQEGDGVFLYDKPSRGGALLDSVSFGAQLADRSIGRMSDGAWTLTQPTFGGPNITQPVGDPRALKINEWLADAINSFASDFIELHNSDALPVSLGGLYLTDEPGSAPMRHLIHPLSFVEPGGHLLFLADGDPDDGPNHLNFKLSPQVGFIALLAPDLGVLDSIFYKTQSTDVSEGRRPSGSSTFGFMNPPTPGAPNPGIISTSGSIVLNEIQANNGSLTNADGTITDWVEVFNGATNDVDLSDMSLTDTVTTPRRWVFPAGVLLPPGAYLIIRCNPDSPASTNNEAVLNTGFGLGASGDDLYLFDAPIRGGAPVDSIVFGLQASDFSIGRLPNGSGPWQLCVPTRGSQNLPASLGSVAAVRINEWLADPKSGEDDWFEIHNPNAQPVNISGLIFTDNLNDRNKPAIPALSFLGTVTNGFVKIIADSEPSRGANHADFKLDKDGDIIALVPPGTGPAVDVVSFGLQGKDLSEGRFPDASANFTRFPGTPSPGESNFLPLESIAISEALTHSDPPFEDAIELQNLSSEDVDLGGWYLSDSKNDLKKFSIPDGTVLAPGAFVVFYEYQFNPEPGRSLSFSLSSAKGDQIYLSTANEAGNLTGYRAAVKFGPSENGVSFGRYETSAGPDFPSMLQRTLGVDNPASLDHFRTGTGLSNAAPVVGPVVIHEVMYHPPDIQTNDNVLDEFIELRNISAGAVSLYDPNHPTNTWRLRDGVDFDFPGNTSIPAGGYLLLVNFNPTNVAQLAAFRAKFGVSIGVPVFGPYGGKLDNGSDSVELYKPDSPQLPPSPDAGLVPYVLVDKVKYSDSAPWPSLADGNTNGVGYSIQRRVGSGYGNDPVNWLAGTPTPGAATGPAPITLPSITTQPSNQNGPETGTMIYTVVAAGAAPLSYQWRFNGNPIVGATGASLILTNVRPMNEGRYAVLVSNPAGAISSVQATLSLRSPPVITADPESRIVLAGATADFSVTAIGSSPLRYQWRKDGLNLSNRTNATLAVVNVQAANQGSYTVVITNIYGSVTSAPAQLTINTPPVITAPPTNLVVNAGATASFSVTAAGSPPFRYDWRFNGTPIPGETNSLLVLNNVQGGSAGGYSVRVTNAVGAAISPVATLTVVLPPVITLAASDPSAAEPGANTGVFTISRSYVTNLAVAVNLVIDGTANNGGDYVSISSPVTIPANQSSATVIITPLDDATPEFPETVTLTIAPGTGYTIGAQNNATVTIGDDDNQAPSVTLTSPTNGTLFLVTPTNIAVTATASDNDGTISKVEFFWQGTNKIGEATSEPYTITWVNAPAGSNVLTAVATDNLARSAASAPVYLVLNAVPTVSITSPANGASFAVPASITINATADDSDGTVTQVQFFAGITLLDTDTTAPFGTTWSDVPVGDYSLTAVATDNRGATRTSTAANITVNTGTPVFVNNFASRNTVTGTPLTITGSSTGTTAEDGEPNPLGSRNSRTVWIAWTASAPGQVVIDTFNSSFDTVLAVYTGNILTSLTTIAANDDFNGNQSQVTFTAVAGTTYSIQVAGFFSNFQNGNITLHIVQQLAVPVIAGQPQAQSVPPGTNVLFSVTASGAVPLTYQWRFNGVNIPGATGATLALANVQGVNEGNYSVVINNSVGSATSANAKLTINDGLFMIEKATLLPLNTVWKYEEAGIDRGATWRQPAFDDAAWASGPALLGAEDTVPSPYPFPFSTPLKTQLTGAPVTTYFRAHFNFSSPGSGVVTLTTTNYVDDGAIFYINGIDAGRLRMAGGVTNFFALASAANPEGQPNVVNLGATNLVSGDNVLAVEVHQSTASFNPDIAFGLTLTATVSSTNRPVLLNPQPLGDGTFELTLAGIAGRRYALDATLSLGTTWTTLVTFTNLTGQTTYLDTSAPPGQSRFYRARFVP